MNSLLQKQYPSRSTAEHVGARHSDQRASGHAEHLARGLGWFSIALGAAEILFPHTFARLIGVRSRPLLFMGLGLREIASGIGVLTPRVRGAALWSRVAGDAMDLSLLAAALVNPDSDRRRVEAGIAAVVGVTVLDVLSARQHTRGSIDEPQPRQPANHFVAAITIDRSAAELYRAWRDFENLPRFMRHLQSVHVIDERRSHWVANAPAGRSVEWDAEITEDRVNEAIAWRSMDGGDVANSGSVRFQPAVGGRGTVVRVEIDYAPPGGSVGATIAKLFGEEPEQQVNVDLHRFKQVMELGFVTTTEGQPAGRAHSTSRLYDDMVRG